MRRPAAALFFVFLAVAGCGEDAEGGLQDPPAACTSDPIENADCGAALDELCRAQTTEAECLGVGPFDFSGTSRYRCDWARSVTLGDTATCGVASATRRCVAVAEDPQFRCKDACGPEAGGVYGSAMASLSSPELLILTCVHDAMLGPIDATFLYSDDSFTYLACGPGLSPEAPADLCSCTAAACEAAVDD